MKKGALEAHVRQVIADYAWVVELAQERLNLYQRLVPGYRPDQPWQVTAIEEEQIYAERFVCGSVDTLILPLHYLWVTNLATVIAADQARAREEQVRQTEAQAQAAAHERQAADRLHWRLLVATYGEAGPPQESSDGAPDQ